MKKILKITLLSLVTLVVLIVAVLHISYHSFSPDDKGVAVVEKNLVYFQESYDDCRQAFLAEAKVFTKKYDSAEIFSVRVPSEVDQELYIDFLYLPPLENTGKLLFLSSAVHGVEGFVGSAAQQMFLKEQVNEEVLSEMGILIAHGVNPYGFKYKRRCTENNVDLNRGSEIDPSLFEIENTGYTALNDMLNPVGKVSEGSLRNRFFYLVTISKMLKESMGALRQSILQGQYEIPEGVYFGGIEFEPQIDSLQRILPEIFSPYETILAIDLHTGYGARRVLHLFPNKVDNQDIKDKTEAVFSGQHIDWGDSDDFYEINGGFASSFLGKLAPEATYLYMVFEWGTSDTQKTFGSIKSLQKVINENQGFQYGYKNEKQEQKVGEHNLDLYYSDSEAWRSEVMRSGREMLGLALENYGGL